MLFNMNVEIFSLCDAATNDFGKINMLGAFDTLRVEKLPAVHPQCAIALRVRFRNIEQGQHKVTVSIVDEDGKNVIPPMQGGVNVVIPEGQSSVSINMLLTIQGLKIEKFGEHSIDLAIDGRQESSLPLFVTELKRNP
ncbi:MAG: hypothetical protein WC975_16265 [Phycisphaerae bacterium]